LPAPLGPLLQDAHEQDILLTASGLAFYAIISFAPLAITVLWIAGLILGDDRIRRFGSELKALAPSDLGIDTALQQAAAQGTSLGLPAALTAIWPATSYGSGLTRAFDRLSVEDRSMPGVWGRAFVVLALLPLLTAGALVASYLGTAVLGVEELQSAGGLVAALVGGFAITAAVLALIFRVLPPTRLAWRQIARAAFIAAAGTSLLSLAVWAYLLYGSDFEEHYATSALASVVLVGVWLYLSNALILLAYRATQLRLDAGGRREGASAGRG
jgi:membrane protein